MTASGKFKLKVGSSVAVLLAAGLAVMWQTFSQEASSHRLTLTHEVLARLADISFRAVDAELVARAFASNPDDPGSREGLGRSLADLRAAQNSAVELDRLVRLDQERTPQISLDDVALVRRFLDEESGALSAPIHGGDPSAVARVLGELNHGSVISGLRAAIVRLQTAERAVLRDRMELQRNDETLTLRLFLLRMLLAFVLFFGVGWRVLHDMAGRDKAERTLAAREAQYRQVVELAGDIICRTDAQGRFTFLNQTALTMLHFTETEIIERSYLKLIRKSSRRKVERFYLRQLLRGQKSTYYEFPLVDGHGHERWIGQNVQLVFDDSGNVAGFQAIARDISERKRAEFELEKSRKLVERIATTTPGILYVYDLDTRRNVFNNREIVTVLGYAPEQMQGFDDVMKWLVHPDDQPMIRAHYESIRHAVNNEVRRLEYRARHSDGHWVWLSGRETAFERGDDGLVKQVVGISQDVTARKAAQETLAYQANYDALTGLLNRRHFGTRLQSALRRASLENAELSICLFDVDHFKDVNDRFGHAAGDEVLEEVGNVVRGELRTHDLAGRLGGDEFCIALPGTGSNEALRVAERIRERFGNIEFGLSAGSMFYATATFGVAESHPDITVKELLEAADRALYRAKSAGRNRVAIEA